MILRPPRSTRTDTLFPYTPLFLSPVRRAALARVAGHGRSFPKRWARPAVLNAWMDPKDNPGAYNPCGVPPDPSAPATLAGRDTTHQLPASSASASASTTIAWTICGLTKSPLETGRAHGRHPANEDPHVCTLL